MTTHKRRPEEVLEKIFEPFEPDIDLELERTLAMSPAEVRASLASRGHDVRALEAQARAFLGLRRRSSAGYIALIAAPGATLAAIIAQAIAVAPSLPIAAHPPHDPPAVTAGPPPEADPAWDLRVQAAIACDASRWRDCLAKLDEARAIDPAGEDRVEVKLMRERAARALKKEGGTP